jgi:poly(hydroxyalkanoate) depolymerase family esterase
LAARPIRPEQKVSNVNNMFFREMLEATRLTRGGRLNQATALLQRVLRGRTGSDATPEAAPKTRQGVDPVRGLEILDQAPSTESARSRTDGGARRQAAGAPRTQPPADVHGLLGRIGSELGSLVGRSKPRDITPSAGQFIAGSYANHAGVRGYKLYVPSCYRGQALPLIVMLHGCTQTADDFAAGTRMNVIAEERGCFVVYPEQAASAHPARCWNWFRRSDQERGGGEPSLIAGITRKVMRDYQVDSRRVYVAGLSAGAAAAAIMGASYGDLYAAIGMHSGLACGAASDLPSAVAAMRQGEITAALLDHPTAGPGGGTRIVPTIVFHGDQDSTVHPRNSAHVIARWANISDLRASVHPGRVPDGHAYSRTVYRNARGQPMLEQWDIHGCAHAWSGGSAAGTFTDPRGPDASREMIRFFLEHPHPEASS